MCGPSSRRATATVHSSSPSGGSGAAAMAVPCLATKFCTITSCAVLSGARVQGRPLQQLQCGAAKGQASIQLPMCPVRLTTPGCGRSGGAGGGCAAGPSRGPAGSRRCLRTTTGGQGEQWQPGRQASGAQPAWAPQIAALTNQNARGEGHSLLPRRLQGRQPQRRLLQHTRAATLAQHGLPCTALPMHPKLPCCLQPLCHSPCRGSRGARPQAAAAWAPRTPASGPGWR